jgi:P-type Cu+ transporter
LANERNAPSSKRGVDGNGNSRRKLKIEEPSSIDVEPGLGLKATVIVPDGSHSCTVCVGNRTWMNTLGIEISQTFENEMSRCENLGCTAIVVAVDGNLVGVVGLLDTLKEDATISISALMRMGIDVHMITGDNKRTASIVAEKLGIPHENVQAEVLPENKSNAVKKLQEMGKIVAMVGDGINDSPALAQADIGIAVGQGSEIAIEAADVVLVKDNLEGVVIGIHLSRHVFKRILLNFIWALGYNMLGIPLAAGLFYPFFHIGLPPQFAGLAMAFSSVSVVCSSLHLKYYKKPDIEQLNMEDTTNNNDKSIVENVKGCFKRLFDGLTRRGYQTLATFDEDGYVYSDDDDINLVRILEEEDDDAELEGYLYGEENSDEDSRPDIDGFDGLELV